MKITSPIAILFISAFLAPLVGFSADEDATNPKVNPKASQSEFEQFRNQQTSGVDTIKAEFDQYKKELDEGFSAYKKAYKEARKAEKKAVKNVWGDYRPGDNKKWVQYDKGGVRKSVNFESGEVELEIIVDEKSSSDKAEETLKKKIFALLKTSRRQAFENDRVAQAVENKIKDKPQVKTANVAATPMMSSLISQENLKNDKKLVKVSKKYTSQSKTDTRPAKKAGKKVVRVKFKIPTDAPTKSKQFIPSAKKIADKEKLPLTLVMAVMETESAFNPMAKSGVPAYGLMQIVPRSAGQDATAYLFGKAKILSPSYLYDSDNNIKIGAAYLHILYFRYLKKIENPVSRLYCAIAAYNTGAGNVARAFIGTTNIGKASTKINKLTPKQVYQKLRTKLPYEETQRYVKKVSRKMQKYQQI